MPMNKQKRPQHPDSELITMLGGTAAVARLVNVKSPSISGWRVNGIPSARRQYLAVIRPDVFKSDHVRRRQDGNHA